MKHYPIVLVNQNRFTT